MTEEKEQNKTTLEMINGLAEIADFMADEEYMKNNFKILENIDYNHLADHLA